MIPDLKQITTRKGDRMAIVQLEDLSGSCEAIVFPKTYVRLSEFLLTDTRLLVWGTIDKKSDNCHHALIMANLLDFSKKMIINFIYLLLSSFIFFWFYINIKKNGLKWIIKGLFQIGILVLFIGGFFKIFFT